MTTNWTKDHNCNTFIQIYKSIAWDTSRQVQKKKVLVGFKSLSCYLGVVKNATKIMIYEKKAT